MGLFNNLPFALGTTYADGQTVYSTSAPNLEGKIYRVETSNPDGSIGSRQVRIVRNSSGAAVAGPTLGQRGLRYGVTAGSWNRKIRGLATAKTDYGVVPDEGLTTSVPANDLFYVIEKGPAKVWVASKATGSVAFTAGKAVYFGRTGGLLLQILTTDGTAERHPVGSIVETITAAVTGNRATTVIIGGLMESVVA